MPWSDVSSMDLRLRFISSVLADEAPFSVLCAGQGISRKTGYKWLLRYRDAGAAGLSDRSSARLTHADGIDPAAHAALLALRRARPNWGPRKLLARLAMDDPALSLPAASTAGDLLYRAGLVRCRPRRVGEPAVRGPLVEPLAANDSWAADFKGWFRTGDGVRCEPLTVTDGYSRRLLVCQAVPMPTFAAIRPLFVQAFREHGLPLAIRTDNGSPFASMGGLGGLTRFSVWLLGLGIWPDRIAPGRPDQNGRHERMHRTLAEEATRPRASNVASQQERMDAWREDYNTCRPHEALGQRCPASLHERSPRPYREQILPWSYPADHHVRQVSAEGYIRWQDRKLYLSEALVGEQVALARHADSDDWVVRYRYVDLGRIDQEHGTLRRSGLSRSQQARTP